MDHNNEAKVKEQISSRLTEPKKGLAVTKGEEWRRVNEEGGRRVLRGIIIGIHGVGGVMGRQYSMEKKGSDSVHFITVMDSDGKRGVGGT